MEERLAKLEISVTKMEVRGDHVESMVSEIHQHVVGTPSSDGLVTRVKAVERRQAFHSKVSWTAVVGILGMVGAWIKSKM